MCQNTAVSLAHTEPAADFESRLLEALNNAGLMLMTSIGHRTGLFDALAHGRPVTPPALAEATGLQERYLREWLGGMTVAGVLEHDPDAETYALPEAHAALLTRTGDANMAVYAQFIGQLGAVEDDVVACFRDGGGVPYERYHRFHEIMAEDSGQSVLPALFDAILPLVPELSGRLEAGIRVLDCACGRGMALVRMAARYPRSRFTGYDLSEEAIAWARQHAAGEGLHNVSFEVRDLSDFDRSAEPGAFDLVTTFDGIHDQARPLALLRGIRRSLAPGGVYLAQDIHASSHHHGDRDHPLGPLLYTISLMHCMTVSLAQGGEGLGTMWGRERAFDYLREAGFTDVSVHRLEHDPQNDYFVCRV